MTTFQAAAVSYFGLPEGTVLIPSDPGHIAFHVVLDLAAVAGIADRMNEMDKAQDEAPLAVRELPTRESIRGDWNNLDDKARGKFGSFAVYLHDRWAAVDTDQPPPDPFGVHPPSQPWPKT